MCVSSLICPRIRLAVKRLQQGPDVFKATLAKYEVKRLADAGLNPTEQQRARRYATIFNGEYNTGDTNTGCTNTGCAPAPEPTPQATTIILTADYDAITGQLTAAGLIDGTPIGIDEIRRLACEAEIIPMIFNSEAQPLYLGRTRRKHTKAQKLALYKRDKRCTSCGIHASNCEDNRRVDRRVARRTSYYLGQGKFGDLWCTGTLLHPQ